MPSIIEPIAICQTPLEKLSRRNSNALADRSSHVRSLTGNYMLMPGNSLFMSGSKWN